MRPLIHVALFSLFLFASPARAALIDFESFAPLTRLEGVDLGGVVLTRGSSELQVSSLFPPLPAAGNRVLSALNLTPAQAPFRADFTLSGVTSFSVDVIVGGTAERNFDLFAYDAGGGLLAQDAVTIAAVPSLSSFRLATLSVMSATAIAYVEFSGVANGFNSAILDNLRFEADGEEPVPLPASLLLLGSALIPLVRGRVRSEA